MSVVDLPTNGHRAGLEDAEARRRARADARREPSVTGRELGVRYPRPDGTPRSEEWGRKQLRAVREEGSGTRAETRVGTRDGTAPAARPARSSGTGGTARSGTPKRTGTARGAAQDGAPRWERVGKRCAVGVVAAVAGLLSYSHIRSLAILAGNGWEAYVLPLSLDGLVAACTFTLAGGRGLDLHVRLVAWAGIAVGLVGSVAGNVIAVDPSIADMRVVARVLAAFPPIALAVSAHLLVQANKKPGKR